MSRVIVAMNHAAILSRAGEVTAAAEVQRRGLQIARGTGDAVPPGFATHLGSSLLRLARYDEALRLFQEDLQIARASGNRRFENIAERMLGAVLVKQGRLDEAERHLARAEQALRANATANGRLLQELALVRAENLLESGRLDEAEAVVASVLEALGYPANPRAPGIGSALSFAARVALARADGARAQKLASDGIAAASVVARDPRRSAHVGHAQLLRARAGQLIGLERPAREDAEAAAAALDAGLGADHPEAHEARELAARLVAAGGR